jgi:hypothetical protein
MPSLIRKQRLRANAIYEAYVKKPGGENSSALGKKKMMRMNSCFGDEK